MTCKIQPMEVIQVPTNDSKAQVITDLKRRFDYFEGEQKTIIIKKFLRERPHASGNDYQKVEVDWFDYEPDYKWLLVRLHASKKYARILFRNVHDCFIKEYGGD